jgi:hypothetical protein
MAMKKSIEKNPNGNPVRKQQGRQWVPSGLLYPLTITIDLLLVLDLIRLDPLPFVDELLLIALGFFLNRASLRRLGWLPSTARKRQDDHGQQ